MRRAAQWDRSVSDALEDEMELGRRRDQGSRPEERGRGPGKRPRARAVTWSWSLNGCSGKEDTLALA